MKSLILIVSLLVLNTKTTTNYRKAHELVHYIRMVHFAETATKEDKENVYSQLQAKLANTQKVDTEIGSLLEKVRSV